MKNYLNKIKEGIKRVLLLLQVFIVKTLLFLVYILGFGSFFVFSLLKTAIKGGKNKHKRSLWHKPLNSDMEKRDILRQS
jgi:hypothetical protein